MRRSSVYHLGASSSSPSFQPLGDFSEEEERDVIAKKKKKRATIEQEQQQQQIGMAEGTRFQNKKQGKKEEHVKEEEYMKIQNKKQGKKKEEYVTVQERKEEEYMKIQNKKQGKKEEEYVTVQERKEEEYMKIQVEPDVPKVQAVEAQNSFSNSGPWNESESGHGVMSYAVLIILVVAEVILGLDFFGVI